MEDHTKLLFRIILVAVLVLTFVTYPWHKKPFVDYGGMHIYAWVLLMASFLLGLAVYTRAISNLFLYASVAIIMGIVGVVLLVKNYLK